jgi:hypothetical protein
MPRPGPTIVIDREGVGVPSSRVVPRASARAERRRSRCSGRRSSAVKRALSR